MKAVTTPAPIARAAPKILTGLTILSSRFANFKLEVSIVLFESAGDKL